MRTLSTIGIATAFAVALSLNASAQTSPAASPAPKATHKTATVHSSVGTIESYDAAAHTLTVKGSKTTATFNVADAKILVGSKSMTSDELSKTGSKVTVKYTEKEGQKVASSVHITPAPAAKAPATTPAK